MQESQYYSLSFIYSHKTLNKPEEGENHYPSFYEVLSFFAESDKVTWDKLREIFENLFSRPNLSLERVGPFENLSELNEFVLKVCGEFHFPYAYTLSVVDYNASLLGVHEVRSYRRLLSSQGKKVLNPAFRGDRSSFFKRIFRET